jgi:hypothetical protein
MKTISSAATRRGIYVIGIIIIGVLLVVLIGMLGNTGNFNNQRVVGTYSGSVSIEDQDQIWVNITFDGEGAINGVFSFSDRNQTFSGMSYVCVEDQVQFSIYFYEPEELDFVFRGSISSDGNLIGGDVELIDNNQTSSTGSFSLSLIDVSV